MDAEVEAGPSHDGQVTLHEVVVDPSQLDPATTVIEEWQTEAVRQIVLDLLETFDERERLVLEQRLGIYDGESRTLREVGDNLNISYELVRQIQARIQPEFVQALRYALEDQEIIG